MWLALALLLSGCAGTATVQGTVTWQGHPVERGKISFLPEDDKGPVVGTDIIQGKYRATQVPLGKKRVDIEIIDASIYLKPLENTEKAAPASPQPSPPPATIRGLAAQVDKGEQTLDFALPAAP
jgi:hypothetical protein